LNSSFRRRDAAIFAGGLTATAAAVGILRAIPGISLTTVGLALLLVVLGAATLGRLWIAIAIALAATLAFNYFFFPPVGTLTIADPHNWVALIAFLATAVIASQLSAVAQARASEAISRRNEVTRLFDLTRDVLLTTETAGAIETLARHVARRFELSRIAVCMPGDEGWQVYQGGAEPVHVQTEVLNETLARARGTLEFDAHQRTYGGHVVVPGGSRSLRIVPLRHGTNPVGLLIAEAPDLDAGSLDAVAGVVAIAVERTQFLAEREAAELVRQKAELAATLLASLSHDLRTPLTAIRVAVENLRNDLPAVDRQQQAGAAIAELDRLTRLFQDILDMARIDAAAVDVERQWVTPADVVDAATAHVRHSLNGHHLRVQAEADVQVEIDPRIVSVALSHLLENAARYSPAEQDIDVDAHADRDGLHISVTDRGAGLDPAELEHLFERFYRGQKARRLSPGTGMGLAITRGLLAAVGGRVWAENVPGAGARFRIRVPAGRRQVPLED
jgi:two-component system sensor histidine kinase KdpD